MRVLLITLVAALGLVAFLNMSGAQTVQDVYDTVSRTFSFIKRRAK